MIVAALLRNETKTREDAEAAKQAADDQKREADTVGGREGRDRCRGGFSAKFQKIYLQIKEKLQS